MFKVGDKILCKKSKEMEMLRINEIYTILSLHYVKYVSYPLLSFFIKDIHGNIINILDYELNYYFYSSSEIRKMKLDKIQENES